MNEKTNGVPLEGPKLEEALNHDSALKTAPAKNLYVFKTDDVIEANAVPCTACTVREGVWCAGSVPSPLPGGGFVADFAHVERLQLARSDVSRAVEFRLSRLRARLPTGDALKADKEKHAEALAYADTCIRIAMAQAVERAARDLNVEPQWLMKLGNSGVKVGVDPAAPGGDRTVHAVVEVPAESLEAREVRLEHQVNKLWTGIK